MNARLPGNQKVRQLSIFSPVAIAAVFAACSLKPETGARSPLVINEFMAKNSSANPVSIADEAGEADDWIEFFNTADTAIALFGLYCSDDSARLEKYRFPDTILAPHGFIVLWADDQPSQGPWHADFKLSAQDGDEIILSASRGRIIDRIQFFASSGNPQARLPNESYGRSAGNSSNWCLMATPTPGTANTGCK